ncbi:MAG: DUF2868 domain-containing protein [Candidatus Binatia bacterium]
MASQGTVRPPSAPLTLAELIDLECRLAADRGLDRQTLRERDGALGAHLFRDGEPQPDRHEIIRRWLAAVRGSAEPGPGERVQAVYTLAGFALAGFGLFTGAGTAAMLLRYDGTHPVNIVHFLSVFVGFQFALCALALVHMLPRGWLGWVPGFGPLHEAIRHLGYRRGGLESWFVRLHGEAGQVSGALARLKSWSTLYADVERWSLLALTQRVGVFFNIGALATCIYLIGVTDLAFAWSTTLSIDSSTMTRMLQTLALPWAWLRGAVPDADLVEASRYFRQEGAYDPTLLKNWWAFLIAALLTYGLLPRTALWLYSGRRLLRARRQLRLDHGECQAALERLSGTRVGWVADTAGESGEREHELAADAVAPTLDLPAAGEGRCVVLGWADVPLDAGGADRLVRERFGWRSAALHAVGGADVAAGQAMVDDLRSADPGSPVVVVAEAFEPPSKALQRFLTDLRRAIGRHRPIVVGLVGGSAPDWKRPPDSDRVLWERAVALLADPYVRVEELVTS